MTRITLSGGDLGALGLYLLVVIGMGFWFSRNEKTSEDYLLGGRRIPWFAVGISYMMSLMSTISLVAVPGEIFNHGLSLMMLSLLYPLTSVAAFFIFVRFYFRLQSFTPFAYLERRYDRSVRLLVSIIYLWSRLIYLAMVLFTTSKVFEGGAGWTPWVTILVAGAIGILYTVLGGMKAVVWTDVLQFFVLVGGLTIAMFICAANVDGGFGGAISYALEHGRGPTRYMEGSFYAFSPYVRLTFWLLLLGAIMEPLFYGSADQISIQRLLSTSSYKSARKAIITNALAIIPFTFLIWFIGLAIYSYYGQHPDPRVTSGDTALFTFIATRMPTPLPGLMLAAMMAAAMSTLDSGMNSLSAVGLKEFYVRYFRPDASERQEVKFARLLTFGVGAFAVLGALGIVYTSSALRESVMESMAIWSALGTVLVPAYLLAVTTRRVTGRLIWNATALCWGINLGMVTWYLVSKRGMTGAIGTPWLLVPAAALVALAGAGLCLRSARPRLARALAWSSLLPFGYLLSTAFWYGTSHLTAGGALSFQWTSFPGTVTFLLIGYGALPFLREQAPEKHTGLTLWSVNAQARASTPEER